MDWRSQKVRKSPEKGPVPCSQSIYKRNNGLAQAEKASSPNQPPPSIKSPKIIRLPSILRFDIIRLMIFHYGAREARDRGAIPVT